MKVIKSLLLGSAAFLAVGAAAQAADLPSRKSAPAEYVKICDAYGAGYFYIPGSDTCLRVGGYVRAEYAYIGTSAALTVPSFSKYTGGAGTTSGANTALVPTGVQDQSGFLARGRLDLDARTQSPYGTVRTFVSLRMQNSSGVYADNYSTGAFTGQSGTTSPTLENALVQFAGFTFGRSNAEIFSFMPGYGYDAFPAAAGFPAGVNMLAYTATFGGGFSATIGLEDRQSMSYSAIPGDVGANHTRVGAPGAPPTTFNSVTNTAAFVNGPSTWPALTANLRFDQSWGAVQVMGQVLQNSASSNFTPASAGGSNNITVTQIGWAVGAGLKLNLPMLAAGDSLYATAAYANGDLDMLTGGTNTNAVTANGGRGIGGLSRIDRNMYVYPVASCAANAQTTACFKTEQTTGWSTAAYFTHYWTPTVRSVLLASYLALNPGTATKNLDWTQGGLSNAQEYYVGGQLIWSPVKDLDIGAELSYARLNQRFANVPGIVPTAQVGTNIAAGGSVWEGRLRVARSF